MSCGLCRDADAMPNCSYSTYEQKLFTAHQNYVHRVMTSPGTRNSLEQRARKIEAALYVVQLRETKETMLSLPWDTGRRKATTAYHRGKQIQLRQGQLQVPTRPRNHENQQLSGSLRRPNNRQLCQRFRKTKLLMEQSLGDDVTRTTEKAAVVRKIVDPNLDSNTHGNPKTSKNCVE